MHPQRLQLSTDYAELQNDSMNNTISVTVPNGFTYNPSTPLLGEAFLDVGTANSPIRARGTTSRLGFWIVGTFIYSEIKYDIPSLGTPTMDMGLFSSLYRVSPTRIRLAIETEGTSGAPNFRIRESQTITFVFSTFKYPVE